MRMAMERGLAQMAKKFIDSDIYSNEWFCELKPFERDLYFYVLTSCDHAGILKINLKSLNFTLGSNFKLEDLQTVFGDKMVFIKKDKVFLKQYIKFQYFKGKEKLNPRNNCHKGVIRRLEEEGFDTEYIEGLTSPCLGSQDKDKDKEKDKDKDKDIYNLIKKVFDDLSSALPLTASGGIGNCVERLKPQLTDKLTLESFWKASQNYKNFWANLLSNEETYLGKRNLIYFIEDKKKGTRDWIEWVDRTANKKNKSNDWSSLV